MPVKRKRGIQIFIKAWGIRKKTEHIDPFKRRNRVGFGFYVIQSQKRDEDVRKTKTYERD